MRKQIFKGYTSCIKEILCLKNDREFFDINFSLLKVFFILGCIGVLRNVFEVLLSVRIHPKWYVMDRDILFTMFFFSIYLCFFGAFTLHSIGKLIGTEIEYKKIFAYTFYLQILHLTVPFFDFIGLRYHIPWYFYLSKPYVGNYFTNGLVMTLGIIFIWLITIYLTMKIFILYFKVSIIRTLVILFISFNILYWPIYHIWPTFNTIFNLIFNLPNNHLNGFYWGYGTFFMFFSFIGTIYFKRNFK